jgi:hypothetical protein
VGDGLDWSTMRRILPRAESGILLRRVKENDAPREILCNGSKACAQRSNATFTGEGVRSPGSEGTVPARDQ